MPPYFLSKILAWLSKANDRSESETCSAHASAATAVENDGVHPKNPQLQQLLPKRLTSEAADMTLPEPRSRETLTITGDEQMSQVRANILPLEPPRPVDDQEDPLDVVVSRHGQHDDRGDIRDVPVRHVCAGSAVSAFHEHN